MLIDGSEQQGHRHQVPVIGAVTAVMDEAAEVPMWPLSDAELLGVVDGCEQELARIAALQLRAVREIDGRNIAPDQGATSTAALLRHRLRLRPGDAHARVDLAAAVDSQFTLVGQALTDGTLSAEQALAVFRALRGLPKDTPAETVRQAEELLVGYGVDCFDPAELARLGKHLREQLARRNGTSSSNGGGSGGDEGGGVGAGGDGDADDRPGQLWLTDTEGGRGLLRGDLDPATNAALRAVLDPLSAPVPAADGTLDLRNPAQRRAEALGELANRVLNQGELPTTGGVRPHITVTATLQTLLGEPGAPAAETDWRVPLSAATFARICCDADITRVLLDPAGVPLDVGRTERLVTPGIRRALVARDRCCAFPSCDRPPSWCVAHHVLPWGQGGETKLWNLVLICERHHATVHHRGWDITFGDDGLPEFIPPPWVDPLRRPRRNPHCSSVTQLLDPIRSRAGPDHPGTNYTWAA